MRHHHEKPSNRLMRRLIGTKVLKRGSVYRRIIAKVESDTREYAWHATKGWHSYRKQSAFQ